MLCEFINVQRKQKLKIDDTQSLLMINIQHICTELRRMQQI